MSPIASQLRPPTQADAAQPGPDDSDEFNEWLRGLFSQPAGKQPSPQLAPDQDDESTPDKPAPIAGAY